MFHNQKNLAELEECCEHPWRDLFLWAVLQNRQQMANYFWAMVSSASSTSWSSGRRRKGGDGDVCRPGRETKLLLHLPHCLVNSSISQLTLNWMLEYNRSCIDFKNTCKMAGGIDKLTSQHHLAGVNFLPWCNQYTSIILSLNFASQSCVAQRPKCIKIAYHAVDIMRSPTCAYF